MSGFIVDPDDENLAIIGESGSVGHAVRGVAIGEHPEGLIVGYADPEQWRDEQ